MLEEECNCGDRLEDELEEVGGCCSAFVERVSNTEDFHRCLHLDLDVVHGELAQKLSFVLLKRRLDKPMGIILSSNHN